MRNNVMKSVLPIKAIIPMCIFPLSIWLVVSVYRLGYQTNKMSAVLENGEIFQGPLFRLVKGDTTSKRIGSQLPICTEGILGQKWYRRKAVYSFDENMISSMTSSCRLVQYTIERAIKCIDSLSNLRSSENAKYALNLTRKLTEFAFVGDSRIRYMFFNFLALIPEYDWVIRPSNASFNALHQNINVSSNLLNMQVSFYWKPLITDIVLEVFSKWNNRQLDPPDWILVGIEVHHMLIEFEDFEKYKQKLNDLVSLLSQLALSSNVIWFNQYPVQNLVSSDFGIRDEINSEKIHKYNQAIRAVLKNYPAIRIWDSSNSLAEEYVRSCGILRRDDFPDDDRHSMTSFHCLDYIHTGYAAISQATQLLFNDMCNYKLIT